MEDDRPKGARVTEAMIGSTTGDILVSWTERDVMLYALGVGAGMGAAETELCFTTENSEGIALAVVPSYVSTFTIAAKPPALCELDSGRFLHAEQRFVLPAPLPVAGEGVLRNTVHQVLDKGSGAILVNRATLCDVQDGRLLAEMRASIFVRGGGGFGGERGDFADWTLPARAPDSRVVQETRLEQALLFRLSGDRHRLHSDPIFARQWGFDRPILHGLCVYGMACRALLAAAAGGDPARLRSMDGRFRKPVMPGDTLTTQIWTGAGGRVQFRTLDGSGEIVFDRGTALVVE